MQSAKRPQMDAAATAGAGRWPAWTPLLIAVLAFAVFVPAYLYDYDRHQGFVWDDDDHYLHDHLVQADDGWWRIWLDPQPGIVGTPGGGVVWNYWPLTRMSVAIAACGVVAAIGAGRPAPAPRARAKARAT